jgi:hypothetical protein
MFVSDISYRESIVQTRRLIAESRRWLDHFYGVHQDPMTCVLCCRESPSMRHLVFARRDDEALSPELLKHLRKFGVCDECMMQHRNNRRAILVALNKIVRACGLSQAH